MKPQQYREKANTIVLDYVKLLLADTYAVDEFNEKDLETAALLVKEVHTHSFYDLSYDDIVYAYTELLDEEKIITFKGLDDKAYEISEKMKGN